MASQGPGYAVIKNFLDLAARTSSGRSNWFKVAEGLELIIFIETTAISGTNDVVVEGTPKAHPNQEDAATDAWSLETFTQISGTGKVFKRVTNFGKYLRIKYTLSASSTFSVIGVLK